MSVQMNIAEAKAKLSALVDAALKGEEVVLARGGKPVAKIVSLVTKEPWKPRHVLKELGYVADIPPEAFDPDPADLDWIDKPLDPDQRR
jgi:prevent-host-death family protein